MPEASIKFERAQSGPNEVFAPEDGAFPHYRPVLGEMEKMGPGKWDRRVRAPTRGCSRSSVGSGSPIGTEPTHRLLPPGHPRRGLGGARAQTLPADARDQRVAPAPGGRQ